MAETRIKLPDNLSDRDTRIMVAASQYKSFTAKQIALDCYESIDHVYAVLRRMIFRKILDVSVTPGALLKGEPKNTYHWREDGSH